MTRVLQQVSGAKTDIIDFLFYQITSHEATGILRCHDTQKMNSTFIKYLNRKIKDLGLDV
jgi:hypothetical protein